MAGAYLLLAAVDLPFLLSWQVEHGFLVHLVQSQLILQDSTTGYVRSTTVSDTAH